MIPNEVLSQHVAVLGKTGSGKTSTAKLAIEQVVAEGARVCVLDPIKSDWWGLTSSANGKHAGLPFHILGGPHGHVPLHSAAGASIANVVASGSLPLSIIDMADFEPGGQARFFVDFAPALLRKMRGVVYLVIEEAHLFAPKERSGIGKENLSIHWAKTMATAGRSKGVRLVLVTQRTQALHNALLGSCDTLIAHRLTAPADQEPVVKWLKANTSKEVLEEVSGSLASLKTGEGWICSGEAKLFQRAHFGRISTYDNTATPTGDGDIREVKTAPIDEDKLRALIGDAVEQAKADDPRELRKQIAEKDRRLKQLEAEVAAPARNIPKNIPAKTVEKFVLKDGDRELLQQFTKRLTDIFNELVGAQAELLVEHLKSAEESLRRVWGQFEGIHHTERAKFSKLLESKGLQKILDKLAAVEPQRHTPATMTQRVDRQPPVSPHGRRAVPAATASRPAHVVSPSSNGDSEIGNTGLRRIMIALAQRNGLTSRQVGVRAGMSASSGSFRTYLSKARTNGWIEGGSDRLTITDAGVQALGAFEPLPEGSALQEYWLRDLGDTGASRILRALCVAYPRSAGKEELGAATGMSPDSGSFRTYLSKLRTLELVQGKGELKASDELFD